MLITYTTIINTWGTINLDYLNIIIISGIIGIFLGDTLLFIALQKIGPRRNNILFSLAAPFTVILNIFFLNEKMSLINLCWMFHCFFWSCNCYMLMENILIINHRWEKM